MQKIFILAANPTDTIRLQLEKEVREIQEGLRRARRRDEFEVQSCQAARRKDIRRALLDIEPNIVHFCGHGEGEEGLIFENNTGEAQFVSAEALAGLFELFADSVKCVVLNACYSRVQAEAIAQHIDYVVGMKHKIEDESAIVFAEAFYDALGAGKPFKFAYNLGCKALQMEGVPEHLTPVILEKRRIATAFLAYHLEDKTFAEQIANALCRRGIMPLLDRSYLPKDDIVVEQLKSAIRRQIVIMPMLSKQMSASETDHEDLRELALLLKDDSHYTKWILPVDLEKSFDAETIAKTVSQHIYELLKFEEAKDINIVIDQRGHGSEPYNFPRNVPELAERLAKTVTYPTLVFRPDIRERTERGTLVDEEWNKFWGKIKKTLETLTLVKTVRKVTMLGDGQLGIAFFMGQYFNRTNAIPLECYNIRHKTVFTNEGQEWHCPPIGGNPNCEVVAEEDVTSEIELPEKIKPGENHETIALYIGTRNPKYLHEVNTHLQEEQFPIRFVFVETGRFKEPGDVIPLIRDVVALLQRLSSENNTKTIRFYTTLPFNVIPLLSANLTEHVIHRVEFMERDFGGPNRPPQEMYVHLPME